MTSLVYLGNEIVNFCLNYSNWGIYWPSPFLIMTGHLFVLFVCGLLLKGMGGGATGDECQVSNFLLGSILSLESKLTLS